MAFFAVEAGGAEARGDERCEGWRAVRGLYSGLRVKKSEPEGVVMDEARKYAYRMVLRDVLMSTYHACEQDTGVRSEDPEDWRRIYERTRRVSALAYWVHNLAEFAATDFAGFDEERFWGHDRRWAGDEAGKSVQESYRAYVKEYKEKGMRGVRMPRMVLENYQEGDAPRVDERRQYAYRGLLYKAMFDLRNSHQVHGMSLNPMVWLAAYRRQRGQDELRHALGNWLHSMAQFSQLGFEGFSEKRFWEEYEAFCKKYPGLEAYGYAEWFEMMLRQFDEGRERKGIRDRGE
jgi:hypothetical protein